MREKVAYIDGFAKSLEDNGVDPSSFFKQAQNSGDPQLQKVANIVTSVIDYVVNQPRQKTAAPNIIGRHADSSWLKELYQQAKKEAPEVGAARRLLGEGGEINRRRFGRSMSQPKKAIHYAGERIGSKPVDVTGRGPAAKQYAGQRADILSNMPGGTRQLLKTSLGFG